MPELPDVVVYIEALDQRIVGHRLERVRIQSPFLLRTAAPPISAVEGRQVKALRRMGKRIVLVLDGNLFMVLHLMIAGRLRWLGPKDKPPGRITLALLEFDNGTLAFTEAGTKRRASIHLVQGEDALRQFDMGGLEVLDADLASFGQRLKQENHTLKRALTDPHIFSGIGNAYSDEILHRAKLSPMALSANLNDEQIARLFDATRVVLNEWTQRLRRTHARSFPRRSLHFARRWRCTAASVNPARCAARRYSASCTPRTRPTTARAARPAARSLPTARYPACCTRAGRGIWTSWNRPFGPTSYFVRSKILNRPISKSSPCSASAAGVSRYSRSYARICSV